MSAAIESLVQQFEARKLTRRELVAALTGLMGHPRPQHPPSQRWDRCCSSAGTVLTD